MTANNLPPINLDDSSTYQYMVYNPTTRRAAISETTKYAGTGTFLVADGIPYRDAINTLRQPQTYTPVWFGNADYTAADVSSIILGDRGGKAVTTGVNSVAISTTNGGSMNQGDYAVAIGINAGETNQGAHCVAIGTSAGEAGQLLHSVAIGWTAGITDQQGYGIAIGNGTGAINQGKRAIAIASGQYTVNYGAAFENQGTAAIAIGLSAGRSNQGAQCIAIGLSAGSERQNPTSIAIGPGAGYADQQSYGIAIGGSAAHTNQQKHAIAIGHGEAYVAFYTAGVNQGYGAIAIGTGAGGHPIQGAFSIYIGYNVGSNNTYPDGYYTPANIIFIDATGTPKESGYIPTVSGTYMRPIRNIANIDPSFRMHYDPVSFELSWGAEASSARFKTRVINLSDRVITNTLELNPVEFDFTDTGRHSFGFIAEDVHETMPEIVVHNPLTDAIEGIEYDKLVAPLVGLAKTHQQVIDNLQTRHTTLQAISAELQESYGSLQMNCDMLKSEYESDIVAIETLVAKKKFKQ